MQSGKEYLNVMCTGPTGQLPGAAGPPGFGATPQAMRPGPGPPGGFRPPVAAAPGITPCKFIKAVAMCCMTL